MLIVGLGNPGNKYRGTKHNIGYSIVDMLAEQKILSFKLGKGEYMYSKGDDLTLLKPLTYMNNSGLALKEYINYFNININQILVIYDDISLKLGQFRFKYKGSAGGQKGVESIIYHLGTDLFLRLKVGIDTEENQQSLTPYVLSPFHHKYQLLVDEVLENCCKAVDFLLNSNINDTMNKYNKKNKEIN